MVLPSTDGHTEDKRAICVFLLTGEGAHSDQIDVSALDSPSWHAVEHTVMRLEQELSQATELPGLEDYLLAVTSRALTHGT